MTALDFFLYDNRTWSSRWGRDWGLKAATGALADRADLKADFDRYCGALPGEQGQLSGFGEAIGGMRSKGGGYLLCVTLESSDSFGRPSWAVFGLWCPDSAMLEHVLSTGDPIASARTLLGSETPPSAIEIRPATVAAGSRRRRRAPGEPAFHRFDSRSTAREVISLLLGAVQSGTMVPNVLGITATSRLATVAQTGFNLVYCHPMDERTDRALARILSPQEPEVEELQLRPDEATLPPVVQQPRRPEARPPLPPPTQPEQRWSLLTVAILWLSVGIIGALILLSVDGARPDDPDISQESTQPVEEEGPVSGDPAVTDVSVPEERSVEAVLDEVGERLEECKELVPEDLSRSPGFVAAETLDVLPKYQERRNRVRQAYSALIDIRGRMVKRQGNYVAYYYDDEEGKKTEPSIKWQKIAEILGEDPLGSKDCEVLKEAFGFEFENGGSVVRRWCDSLGRLEETAVRSLSAQRSASDG